MKRLLFLFLSALPLGLLAQKQIINDEHALARSVSSFHSVKVSNAIDLYLSQGERESMAVSASKPEYRDRIKTTVEDGVLRIWFDNDGKWGRNSNMKLKVYLSFRDLRMLTASGASDVFVNGTVKVNELQMNMSGASDFRGSVEANSLNVDLAGASDAVVSGKVTSLKVQAGGASDFKGYELETDNCSVEASGASDIQVTVNKELSARASGASGVYYKGAGVIREVKTSGSSSISRRS